MAEDRRALHAYLSDEAHETWQKFAEDNGVSMTGLLETQAHELAAKIAAAGGEADEVEQDWVKAARKVDARRRRRGPDAEPAAVPERIPA